MIRRAIHPAILCLIHWSTRYIGQWYIISLVSYVKHVLDVWYFSHRCKKNEHHFMMIRKLKSGSNITYCLPFIRHWQCKSWDREGSENKTSNQNMNHEWLVSDCRNLIGSSFHGLTFCCGIRSWISLLFISWAKDEGIHEPAKISRGPMGMPVCLIARLASQVKWQFVQSFGLYGYHGSAVSFITSSNQRLKMSEILAKL